MRTVLLAYERDQDYSRIETLLQTRGYRVIRARSGVEAIEVARNDSPQVIVSDVLLPRLDGFALCRRLKEDPILQHLPVLLHSFRVSGAKYEAFAAEVGAEKFLSDRTTLEELAAALDSLKPGSGTMRMPAVVPELLERREQDRQRLRELEQRLRVAEAANQQLTADERQAVALAEREARERTEALAADSEKIRSLLAKVAELEKEQQRLTADGAGQLASLQARIDELEGEREQLSTAAAEQTRELQARIDELEGERDRGSAATSEKLQSLQTRIDALELERDQRSAASAEKIQSLQARIVELERVREELTEAARKARGALSESQAGLAKVSVLEKRLAELQTGRAKARAEAEDGRRAFAAQPMPTWLCDMVTGELHAVSDAAAALVATENDQLIGRPLQDVLPGLDLGKDAPRPSFISYSREDGRELELEVSRQSVSHGGRACWLLTTRDVTSEKAGDMERVQREQMLQAIEKSPVASSLVDDEGRLIYLNEAFASLLGIEAGAALGKLQSEFEVSGSAEGTIRTAPMGESGVMVQSARWRRADGTDFEVELTSSPLIGAPPARVVTARDVSAAVLGSARSAREHKCLLTLLDLAQQAHTLTEKEVAAKAAELARRLTDSGCSAFFVAIKEGKELELCSAQPDSADADGTLPAAGHWRGAPTRGTALQECLASGKSVTREVKEDAGALLETGLPETFSRQLVTPVLEGKRPTSALLLVGKPVPYDDDDRRIAALIADAAWQALRRRRSHAEVISAMEHMERVMLGSVDALANLADAQDSCKRGRARRVADLAAGIATTLGLPGHTVRGVRVVGQLIDVGMLQIPREILWQPGQLTDAEFELVKTHAERGYETLRRIEFPWPVAEAVRQHHEHVDGTGYPQGLAGDEILLEARIVAVADAVEAMLSPRPQRDALTLQACLDELQSQAGRRYDARAVKACVKLLQDREARAEGEAAESQIA